MKFELSGDFASKPKLSLDGESVDYEYLDIDYCPECTYTDETGITTTYPENISICFSVKEKTGNLEVNKVYRAKSCVDGTLVLEDTGELTTAKRRKKKNVRKDASPPDIPPNTEEPNESMAVEQVNDTPEKAKVDKNGKRVDQYLKDVKVQVASLGMYTGNIAPHTRLYKKMIAEDIARGLGNV